MIEKNVETLQSHRKKQKDGKVKSIGKEKCRLDCRETKENRHRGDDEREMEAREKGK